MSNKPENLYTSGEPAKESAESVQMDALVELVCSEYTRIVSGAIAFTPNQLALEAMRAALLAIDLPKLLVDAGRYRFLRDTPGDDLGWPYVRDHDDDWLCGETLDEAIDAAMQAEEG